MAKISRKLGKMAQCAAVRIFVFGVQLSLYRRQSTITTTLVVDSDDRMVL